MTSRVAPLALAGLLVLGSIDAWLLTTLIDVGAADDVVPAASEPLLNLQMPPRETTAAKPIDAYRAIVAQPIFFKTRVPYVAPPPAPALAPPVMPVVPSPPPVMTDPGLVLGGIIVNRDMRKIYLSSKADSQGAWVGEGETFKGWKVQSVGSTSTVLQQQNRTIELHLHPPR